MNESGKYPISENKFKELIEPIIKREQKKSGRHSKVKVIIIFFCGVLYILRTWISWCDLSKE